MRAVEVQRLLEAVHQFRQSPGQGLALELQSFIPPGIPTDRRVRRGPLLQGIGGPFLYPAVRYVLEQAHVAGPTPAVGVDDLPPEQGEQVGLQVAVLAKLHQAPDEGDEGLLHEVLAVNRLGDPGPCEGQESALVAIHQLSPRLVVTPANPIQEILLGLGDPCHGAHCTGVISGRKGASQRGQVGMALP